jgi:hypothetical protein
MGRVRGCSVRGAARGPTAPGRAAVSIALAAVLAGSAPHASAQNAPASPGRPVATGDTAGVVDDPGPEQALTQRIAVWRIDALGMSDELVTRLETLFRMELDRLASRPLPTRREIERAIAGSKELRDCSGEDKCLAQVGKKVGVDVVVTGSVAALGDSYTLNVKAVDVATGKQIRRIATDPLRGSPDELIEAVRVAAYRLLAPSQLHGSIAILSDLVGATVTLDGKKIGKTPLATPIGKQTLGLHTLQVSADGYLTFEEKVDVRFQKSTRVLVRLAAQGQVSGVGGLTRPATRPAPEPWYTSPWAYAAVGAAAVLVGATVGWALAKDDVRNCTGPMPAEGC